jgi:four helix bundle protein
MILTLSHTRLLVYAESKNLVTECYRISKLLPDAERFNMVQQLRRAALSVHLNLAEGASRKSEKERVRFFEIARGSVIEVDTILDIALELGYIKKADLVHADQLMLTTFKMLTSMMKCTNDK